jgi:hypothetical protein
VVRSLGAGTLDLFEARPIAVELRERRLMVEPFLRSRNHLRDGQPLPAAADARGSSETAARRGDSVPPVGIRRQAGELQLDRRADLQLPQPLPLDTFHDSNRQ